MKYSKKFIDNYYNKIQREKQVENKIKDKYSTNFVIWSKQCSKINRMMVTQFNYEHGTAFRTEVIR